MTISSQDSEPYRLRAYKPKIGTIMDTSRVYLFLEETYHSMISSCSNNDDLQPPIPLNIEIIRELPASPAELKTCWNQNAPRKNRLRICLINGGGGLGDAIMFAPAPKKSSRRILKSKCAQKM